MTSLEERFQTIYEENKQRLYWFIQRSVRNEDQALDLTQDAFLNFFQAFKKKEIPNANASRAYLFRTARNLVINFGKSAYERRTVLREDLDQISVEKEELPEMEGDLETLLNHLNEKERSAVILYFQEDLKLREIADVMDSSVATTHRLLQGAIRKMADLHKKSNQV